MSSSSVRAVRVLVLWIVTVMLTAYLPVSTAAADEPDPAGGTAGSNQHPGYEPTEPAVGEQLMMSASVAGTGSFPVTTFRSADVVSSGVGQLRDTGAGYVDLSGVSGTVRAAYLFWQGPTDVLDSGANAVVDFNGTEVSGVNLGFSSDNCWGYDNSQAYRADVTPHVTGDGSYSIGGLASEGVNVNGASLVVVFDDGNPGNDRRITIYNGNDSNQSNIYDSDGWNVTLSSIGYEGGPATVELHVADGQGFHDDTVRANDGVLASRGPIYQGDSVPDGTGPDLNGGLWDIKSYDLSSLLTAGEVNDVRISSGIYSDCLSLVVAVVAVQPNALDTGSYAFDFSHLFGQTPFYGFADDPVNTASGNFVMPEPGLGFPEANRGVRWQPTYNSQDQREGDLGTGWTSVLDVQVLDVDEDGEVRMLMPDGRRADFLPASWGYTRPPAFEGDLQGYPGSFRVDWFDGSTWQLDAQDRLDRITYPDGQVVDLVRGADGRVQELRSSTGTGLALDYGGERLTSVTSSDGRQVSLVYGDDGRLQRMTGAGTSHAYSYTDGLLTRVEDGAGVLVVGNTYDSRGRVTSQETPGGAGATYTYDEELRTTTVGYVPSGETVTYEHSPLGYLVAVVDTRGERTELDRQGDGRVATLTDRSGARTSYTYDEHGQVRSARDALGNVTRYDYDGRHRLVSVTDAAGNVASYEYTGDERLPSRVVDPAGGATDFEVVDGRIVRETDADGVARSYDYDDRGWMTSVTDGAGNTTTFSYDGAGNQVRVVSPEGRAVSSSFDRGGRVLEQRTSRGATTFSYDAAGRMTSTVDALGGETAYEYGPDGRLESMTDPDGYTTHYEFDAYGQLVSTIRPGGATTRTGWGELGRVVSEAGPTGEENRYEHDASGRVTAVTGPGGDQVTMTYDALGRVISRTDAGGGTREFEYDVLGRLVREVSPTGRATAYGYDEVGRVVRVTDAEGGESTVEYSGAGRVLSTTDPGGVRTTYEYDGIGNQVAVVDGNGERTRFQHDRDRLLVSTVLPTGEERRITFDDSGLPVAEQGFTGEVVQRDFDALGRLTTQTDGAGASFGLRYDGRGHVTAATDPLGGTAGFEQDGRGNRTSVTDALGNRTVLAHDLADRLTSRTDPLDRSTRYDYDGSGRLSLLTDPSGRTVQADYDADGRPVGLLYGDGTRQTMTHDGDGRLLTAVGPAGRTSFDYDAAGHLVRAVDPDGTAVGYGNDLAGRRTEMTYPDGSTLRYEYDAAGRLAATEHSSAGRSTFTYDASGRLVGQTTPTGLVRSWQRTDARVSERVEGDRRMTYAYDAAGRLSGVAGDEQAEFSYDAAGQLTRARAHGIEEAFDHDAAGSLVGRSVDGAAEAFTVDAAGQLDGSDDGNRYSYDEAGRLTAVRRVDGSSLTLAYDARGLLVQQVASTSGDGDDGGVPDPCEGAEPTIRGTAGDDVLTGTAGDDVIAGGDGDDLIDGAGGSDLLCGGDGSDTLWGRNGDDRLSGGAGDDLLDGENGIDLLVGDAGADRMLGGHGNDALDGGADNDHLDGGLGDDTLAGGSGDDTLVGDRGSDSLEGGAGTDAISGGSGDDHCEDSPGVTSCEILLPAEERNEVTTITRGYGADRLLTHVGVANPDGSLDSYQLTWDRTAGPAAQLVSLAVNGERTDVVRGPGGAYTVTGGVASDVRTDALGDVVGGDLAVASSYSAFGEPRDRRRVVGLGFRGELHIGDLVHLRARDLDPATGRFTTPDPLAGVEGRTTVANPYHYADNDPVNRRDPLGLKPTDGDLDYELAEEDIAQLDEMGVVQQAGFPFWLFNPWHRATQLDLAAKVGGAIECAVPGGGPNGGTGRADVCRGNAIWEVKYFGPTSITTATEQLARYIAAKPGLFPGWSVSNSEIVVGPTKLHAFSVGGTGVRLYFPVPWIRALSFDPLRADVLREWIPEATLAALLAAAGAGGDADTPGWQFPDIHLPDIPPPDPEVVGGIGVVGTIIIACIWFCIPTPWPVL